MATKRKVAAAETPTAAAVVPTTAVERALARDRQLADLERMRQIAIEAARKRYLKRKAGAVRSRKAKNIAKRRMVKISRKKNRA